MSVQIPLEGVLQCIAAVVHTHVRNKLFTTRWYDVFVSVCTGRQRSNAAAGPASMSELQKDAYTYTAHALCSCCNKNAKLLVRNLLESSHCQHLAQKQLPTLAHEMFVLWYELLDTTAASCCLLDVD
jgi:hypothetical protein